MHNFPLLITSYINAEHSTTVELKDSAERLRLTMNAIEAWLKMDPSLSIVVCDGSNSNQRDLIKRRFPKSQIEWISFQNSTDLVEKYGKGYGEGEIISYALEHSNILKNQDVFMKCTAKLWVKDYQKIIQKFPGHFLAKAFFKNVLTFKPTELEYIDTRFFVSSKVFFYEQVLPSYKKSKGVSIELTLKDKLIENKNKGFLINSPMIIEGVGGGIGKAYKNNFRRLIKEKLRNQILAKSKFRELFIPEN